MKTVKYTQLERIAKKNGAQIKNTRTQQEFFIHIGGTFAYRLDKNSQQTGACLDVVVNKHHNPRLHSLIGQPDDDFEIIATKFN